METINCNLCGSGRSRQVYEKADEKYFPEESFSVVECLECGLGYVCPRPTVQEMSKYYPSEFYSELKHSEINDLERFSRQAEYIATVAVSGGKRRLLDVGSANGAFLKYMHQLGWDVEGVEPFANAPDPDGIKIYRTQLPDIPVSEPSYDAITAWAVLEHVHDPKAYFKKAGKIVVKGGLFVFFVPNFSSLATRHLFSEDIPRHLYCFTPDNVRRYLQEAGFSLEMMDFNNPTFVYNPNRWLMYGVAKMLGRPFVWPIKNSYSEFLKDKCLNRGVVSAMHYFLMHPVCFVDAALAPFVGRFERAMGRYAAVIYVARKI